MEYQSKAGTNHLSESRTPERWFAFSAIVFFLISLPVYFGYPNSVVNFQFQDPYKVVALFHVPLGIALFLLAQSVLYFSFRKMKVSLLPALAKVHFLMVVMPLLLLTLAAFQSFPFRGILPESLTQIAWACLAAILLAFFMFLSNVALFIVWQLIKVIGEKRGKNRNISSREG